jgi:hypothetical protein
MPLTLLSLLFDLLDESRGKRAHGGWEAHRKEQQVRRGVL